MNSSARRNLSKLPELTWGVDTRNHDTDSRKIFVQNVSSKATANDLRDFFGRKEVEGVTINHSPKGIIAFVQFHRPRDVTKALEKHQHNLLGHQLKVRQFRNDRDRDRDRDGARRYGQRSYKENHHRSRSPSPNRGWGSSHELATRDDPSPFDEDVPALDYEESQEARTKQMFEEAAKEFEEQRKRVSSSFDSGHSRIRTKASIQGNDLPADIELTLKLVIEQKTALDLSTNQVKKILDYFNTALMTIQGQITQQSTIMQSSSSPKISSQAEQSDASPTYPLGPASKGPAAVAQTESYRLYSSNSPPRAPLEHARTSTSSPTPDGNTLNSKDMNAAFNYIKKFTKKRKQFPQE